MRQVQRLVVNEWLQRLQSHDLLQPRLSVQSGRGLACLSTLWQLGQSEQLLQLSGQIVQEKYYNKSGYPGYQEKYYNNSGYSGYQEKYYNNSGYSGYQEKYYNNSGYSGYQKKYYNNSGYPGYQEKYYNNSGFSGYQEKYYNNRKIDVPSVFAPVGAGSQTPCILQSPEQQSSWNDFRTVKEHALLSFHLLVTHSTARILPKDVNSVMVLPLVTVYRNQTYNPRRHRSAGLDYS
ncbi:hypothetical protein J6590_004198 [Homalodisca vitripennis]|nr:hypothetical protein J6590_004198 [Homalodisca vitripennis]